MKKFYLITFILLLSSCSFGVKEVPKTEVIFKPTKVECGNSPLIDNLQLREITFTVVYDEDQIPWIALSPIDYEKLSKNFAEIMRAVGQKNAALAFYIRCIFDHNRIVDK